MLFPISSVSPSTANSSTRAHPQLRWIHYSSTVTPHTQPPPHPALLPLTTCPTTALLPTLNLPLTLSRLGASSTTPMMIQLFIIPGNNLTRFPTQTREVLSCRSFMTPTPFVLIYPPTLASTRMAVSTLPGLTSPGPLTTFRQLYLPNTTTNDMTRP